MGNRGTGTAITFMDDLRARLPGRVVLTADGPQSCPLAVEAAFGDGVDFQQTTKQGITNPCVERQNLTMGTGMKPLNPGTNAFSKSSAKHSHAPGPHLAYCNFVRPHASIRKTPAMAVSLTTEPYDLTPPNG